jgi:pimeloyl-ACP methyl ester carboxylesterase
MPKDIDDKIAAPHAAFTEGIVETGGARIRYREAGCGPVVVCLQRDGGLNLSRTHELLAADHRVVAIEVPGFADAPAGEAAATDALAATVVATIAALGIERCNLMGASFGATVALRAALRDPERVEAVALVAPTAIGASRDPAFEARLAKLELPVLALFGTRDKIAPTTSARLYRAMMPNCHIVMVYDAAHAIDADRPEATADVVRHFIEHHERFLVTRTSGMIHP